MNTGASVARWTARPERGRAEERDGLAVDGATVADSERMKRTAGKATPGRPGARKTARRVGNG